ncbi:MAG: hypothetical protein ACK4S4_03365 [Pyrinomonadaceae bacterium]
MYRRPKFLEVLLTIREEMAREADYDVDLFAEMVRSGSRRDTWAIHSLTEIDQPARQKRKSPDTDRGSRERKQKNN